MRVYYHEKRIFGKPIQSDKITLDRFTYILENIKEENLIEIKQKTGFLNWIFGKSVFKWAYILSEDFFWDKYFLPNNIIFYSHEKRRGAYFYGKFYFIVQIGDTLELRSFINDDRDLTYKSVANLHREIKDKRIIKKIERSFIQLLSQVKENSFIIEDKNIQTVKEYNLLPLDKDMGSIQSFLNFFSFSSKKELLVDLGKINNDVVTFHSENKEFFEQRNVVESNEYIFEYYLIEKLLLDNIIGSVAWNCYYEDFEEELRNIGFKGELPNEFTEEYFAEKGAWDILDEVRDYIADISDFYLFGIDIDFGENTTKFGLIKKDDLKSIQEIGAKIGLEIY
jgi:hypothetical protein